MDGYIMKPDAVYWDKPDLADDLREMANNLFPGPEDSLRHAMLHSAARRIEHERSGAEELRAALQSIAKQLTSEERDQKITNKYSDLDQLELLQFAHDIIITSARTALAKHGKSKSGAEMEEDEDSPFDRLHDKSPFGIGLMK